MTSKIIVTHEAASVFAVLEDIRHLLPANLPADAHVIAQVQITIPEKPGATQTAAPPSAESAVPAPATPSAPPPAPVSDAPAKKRGRPKKDTVEGPATPPEVSNTPPDGPTAADPQIALPLPPTTPAPAAAGKAVSKDDVRSALHTLVTKHNLELGAAALSRFGARKLSDLKEDQYAAFIAACEKTTQTGEA